MKRVIVFANGELLHEELLEQFVSDDDVIICADGGAEHALALGIVPDRVIGDFDSLSSETLEQLRSLGVPLVRHPTKKDHTDLELALIDALRQQASEIVVVTALGKRLDQLLSNVLLLSHPAFQNASVSLFDGIQTARLLCPTRSCVVTGAPRDTVSLIPLSEEMTEVSSEGLEWELERAVLRRGESRSISNRLVSTCATISVGQGTGLVVHLTRHE